jgi:hypothetical protein
LPAFGSQSACERGGAIALPIEPIARCSPDVRREGVLKKIPQAERFLPFADTQHIRLKKHQSFPSNVGPVCTNVET